MNQKEKIQHNLKHLEKKMCSAFETKEQMAIFAMSMLGIAGHLTKFIGENHDFGNLSMNLKYLMAMAANSLTMFLNHSDDSKIQINDISLDRLGYITDDEQDETYLFVFIKKVSEHLRQYIEAVEDGYR